MFGLGTWEIILILIVAVVFVGPDKLPKVASSIGQGMKKVRDAMSQVDEEVRRAARDAQREIERAGDEDDDAPEGPPAAAGTEVAAPVTSELPDDLSRAHNAEVAATPPPHDADAWRARASRPVEGRVASARPAATADKPSPADAKPGAPTPPAAEADETPETRES